MKSTRRALVLICLLAILGLLTTSCGNDDDSVSSPTAPTPEMTPETTEHDAEDTPMGDSAGGHHNHATPAVNGAKLDATAVVTIPGDAVGDTAGPEPSPDAGTGTTVQTHPHPGGERPADGSPDAGTGTTVQTEIVGGKPVDGVQRHLIDAGGYVTIIVTGDTTDELHIHGYDLVVPFAPNQPGTITFAADIPGIFEVETHHNGDLVMELQVG